MFSTLALTFLVAPLVAGAPAPAPAPEPTKAKPVEVEVRCYDDSNLKVVLLDENIVLKTKYGDLKVPVESIRRIEFANRTPPLIRGRIDAAIKNLGHPDFKTREEATAELRDFKDRAYPAVAIATKSQDPEVARRADEVAKFIKGRYGDSLTIRPNDIIYTDDSKLTGTIQAESLKVQTSQFGEQPLRLWDIKTLRHKDDVPAQDQNAPVAPVNLNSPTYQNQFGKEFIFRLTGSVPQIGQGGIWGTDQYTLDSPLAVAAVHAGVLQNGQTGVVRVRVVLSPAQYVASERNGVNSTTYGNYPAGAYEFIK